MIILRGSQSAAPKSDERVERNQALGNPSAVASYSRERLALRTRYPWYSEGFLLLRRRCCSTRSSDDVARGRNQVERQVA